jgi:hypothetical protein
MTDFVDVSRWLEDIPVDEPDDALCGKAVTFRLEGVWDNSQAYRDIIEFGQLLAAVAERIDD